MQGQRMKMQLGELVARLETLGCQPRKLANGQWLSLCPAHEDKEPSLSITLSESGKILLHCFAGCNVSEICSALGISERELFPDACDSNSPLSLEQFAQAKRIPLDFLKERGWRETKHGIAIPYSLPDGTIVYQLRHSLDKNDRRYSWQKGAKASCVVCGLDFLPEDANIVWITESATDAATLQFCGLPAISVAGKGNAKAIANFADKLSRVDKIIVWQEPDAPNFARDIATALNRDVLCVQPSGGEPKDANRLWLSVGADKERFLAELSRLRERATIVKPENNLTLVGQQTDTENEHKSVTETICEFCSLSDVELLSLADPVLSAQDPLREAIQRIHAAFGIVGEDANLQLLLLALTTRIFSQPISVLVTGGTGQGKSYLTDAACATLPPCCHRRIVGASARALLFHSIPRGAVLQWLEMPELTGDTIAATILRSILWQSQHDVETDYLFVEWTNRGARRRVVKMPKQVALITTKVELPKDEQLLSRFLVLEVREATDKRLAVFTTLAQSWNGAPVESPKEMLKPVTAFHEWLGRCVVRVNIPFACALASLFAELPPSERDYRDFATLLKLTAASAIWNFRKREHEVGENSLTVVADIADYATVRDLLAPIWGKARSYALSEAEWQVYQVLKTHEFPLTVKEISEVLKISESAARGRLNALKRKGIVADEFVEGGKSKAWRLVANGIIADPLPTVEAVLERWQPDQPPQPPAQPSGADRLTAEANDASVGSVEALESVETPSNAKNANKNWDFRASVGALLGTLPSTATEQDYTNDDKNREYGNSSPLASNNIKTANAPTDSEKSQQTLAFSSVGAFSTHPNASTLASADARPNSPTNLSQREEVGQLEWFRCPNCGLRRLMSPDAWLLAGKCPECGADMLPDQPDPPSGDSLSHQPQTDDANEPTDGATNGDGFVDTLEFLEREIGFADPTNLATDQPPPTDLKADQVPDSDQPPEPDQPPRKTKLPPSSCRELANDLLRILREFQRSSKKHQRCLTDPCPICREKVRQVRYLERANSRNGLLALWQRAQQWQQQQGGVGA